MQSEYRYIIHLLLGWNGERERGRKEKTKESEDPRLKTKPLIYPVNPPGPTDRSYETRKRTKRYTRQKKRRKTASEAE